MEQPRKPRPSGVGGPRDKNSGRGKARGGGAPRPEQPGRAGAAGRGGPDRNSCSRQGPGPARELGAGSSVLEGTAGGGVQPGLELWGELGCPVDARLGKGCTQWNMGIFQARVLECVTNTLLQGIFPTQGSNLGRRDCGQILYRLSH